MSNIIYCRLFCLLADEHGSGFFLLRRVRLILTRLCRHETEGNDEANKHLNKVYRKGWEPLKFG